MGQSAIGARFLAIDPNVDQPALAYRVDRRLTSDRARSNQSAIAINAESAHRHTLMPREAHRDGAGDLWLIAPFIGSARGILTLTHLASARDGGIVGHSEAVFAGLQLLGAVAHAHAHGFVNGPLDADQVLVDPSGGLLIEMYGVERRLRDLPVATDAERAGETRSIVALVARVVTGHTNPGHGALASLPPAFRGWIEQGLSETGFASATEAERSLLPVVQCLDAGNGRNRSWIADLFGFLGWALTRRS